MEDKELEHRLELLKQSYDRIPLQDHSEDIMNKIEEQEKEYAQKNQPLRKPIWQKFGVWAIGLASILIFGLIGASFLLIEDENDTSLEQGELTREEISEKILAVYEKEREIFRKKLDLPEEEFAQIPFVKNADFNIKSNSNISRIDVNRDAEEFVKNVFTERYFVLPMDTMNELEKANKLKTEKEAYEFLENYHRMILNYQEYGNFGLEKYEKELERLKVNNKFYLYDLDVKRESLPTELQNILRISESQGLHLVTTDNEARLTFKFNKDKVFNSHIEKILYPLVNSYMMWMKEYPINEDPLSFSFEHTMEPLIHLESILALKDKYGHYNADSVGAKELTFRRILYELIKGEKVFNSTGTVDEKYQDIWLSVINTYPDSLAAFILQPIVVEFTASDWTESSSWESLSRDDINHILKEFMKGDLNMEENEAILIDDDFVQKVHGLFKLYAGSKDPTLLKNATPEEIVGLYYYSIQLKDYDIVYSLYSKDGGIQIPREEFMDGKNNLEIEDIRQEFSSFLAKEMNENETVVIIRPHEEGNLFTQDETIGFQLKKTENGWRPPFMPTQ